MTNSIVHNKVITLAAIGLMSMGSMAYGYYSALPDTHQAGNVTYITGGIGDEERVALEQVRRDYNLHVMNAAGNGAFTGDTTLAIYDRQGNQLVSASADPIFYASLPSGKYTILAENNGVQQKKEVKVYSHSPANIEFVWK